MYQSRVGVAVISAVLLVLPAEILAQAVAGSEPYPAVYMPAFGGVPVDHGDIVINRLSLVAQSASGDRALEPAELIPNKTKLAESIGDRFFTDEERVREAAESGWLDRRLRELGIVATSLEVTRKRVYLDPATRAAVREVPTLAYSVQLQSATS